MEDAPEQILNCPSRSILSMVEVRQEKIDSEGELQVERRERVSTSVESARAGDAMQRREITEATEGQHSAVTQICAVLM